MKIRDETVIDSEANILKILKINKTDVKATAQTSVLFVDFQIIVKMD